MESEVILKDPEIMHGAPCFAGTRVTLETFFDHLEHGYSIDGFLEQFPTVKRQQVLKLLTEIRRDSTLAAAGV